MRFMLPIKQYVLILRGLPCVQSVYGACRTATQSVGNRMILEERESKLINLKNKAEALEGNTPNSLYYSVSQNKSTVGVSLFLKGHISMFSWAQNSFLPYSLPAAFLADNLGN